MNLASAPSQTARVAGAQPAARELDPRLLAGAQRGDAGAQRAFVVMYQGRVLAVCTRMLGERARAEDCAQECFLKALAALPRFDGDGSARLSTWLLTIATRLCLDEIRRSKRVHVPVDDLADALAADDVAEPAALERALRHRVERAVLGLSDELRAAFVLRVTSELSVEETARVLAIDEGTVKSRLSRARAQLREAIGEV